MSSDDAKLIADLKVQVMAAKQEQEILMFKCSVEEEDFKKQAEWLSALVDKKSMQKKEQESESAKFMYDYDVVKNEIDAIEKRSYLKKRYVAQY